MIRFIRQRYGKLRYNTTFGREESPPRRAFSYQGLCISRAKDRASKGVQSYAAHFAFISRISSRRIFTSSCKASRNPSSAICHAWTSPPAAPPCQYCASPSISLPRLSFQQNATAGTASFLSARTAPDAAPPSAARPTRRQCPGTTCNRRREYQSQKIRYKIIIDVHNSIPINEFPFYLLI